MRVYVASKFEDRARASQIMNRLTAVGHVVTHDWTQSSQFSMAQAHHDREGVMTAEALVIIAERDYPFRGTYVELGMALARGIPIYLLGEAMNACIFVLLPEVHRGLGPLLNIARP